MPDPSHSLSDDAVGQNAQQHDFRSNGWTVRNQHPDNLNPGKAENPILSDASELEHTYFRAITRLNALRERVKHQVGFSACDLVILLDRLACKANFDPVGAVANGKTSDEFFRNNAEFNRLESELALKIAPNNVSEILSLIKDTSYYTPTRRIVTVMEVVYQHMLGGLNKENPFY